MNLKNIAIIMDGNGRWAKKNNLQIKEGHARGVSALKEIVKESVNQNIESLTVYAFSTENWKRPKSEVKAINNLIVNSINNELEELIEQKVKVRFFGDYSNFGKKTYEKIKFAEEKSFFKKPKIQYIYYQQHIFIIILKNTLIMKYLILQKVSIILLII